MVQGQPTCLSSGTCVSTVPLHRCNLTTCLQCYLTNVRSLLSKLTDFEVFIDTHKPDILVLTETWLDDHLPNSLFAPSQMYNVFRNDQLRGSGVCVLIKKTNCFSVRSVEIPDCYNDIEIVAVYIHDSSGVEPLRLVAVYSSAQNSLLFSALNHLADGSARLCVLGDLNLPNFDLELVCSSRKFSG